MSDYTTLTISLPVVLAARIRERSELTGYPLSGEVVAALDEYYAELDNGYAAWSAVLEPRHLDLLVYYIEVPLESMIHSLRLANLNQIAVMLDESSPVYVEALRTLLRIRIQEAQAAKGESK